MPLAYISWIGMLRICYEEKDTDGIQVQMHLLTQERAVMMNPRQKGKDERKGRQIIVEKDTDEIQVRIQLLT